MADRLQQMGMAISTVNPVIDPEAGKYLLDVMIKESGASLLYHSWASNVLMDGDRIQTVFLETKSGRVAVNPKMVVDCTGDGDILGLAGEGFENFKYHIGLVHRLGNVDRVDTSKPGYKKLSIGNPTPIPSVNWVNMHGDDAQDGIDAHTLSTLQQKYRIAIWERVEKLKTMPGYEKVFLLDTASQIGVRMSRISRRGSDQGRRHSHYLRGYSGGALQGQTRNPAATAALANSLPFAVAQEDTKPAGSGTVLQF